MSEFGTFSLADIAMQQERVGALRAQRQQAEREVEANQKLATLLPQAVQGSPEARQQLAAVGTDKALEWYMKLDDRDRTKHKEQVSDAIKGIRWADTPERWEQAKGYFRRQGLEIPDLPFEAREQAALELGQIGAYMESAPKLEWKTVEAGGAGGTFDPRTGQFDPVIAPNPGDQQFGAPAQGPQPGQVEDGYRFKGGNPADPNSWEKVGGQTASQSGTFRPVGIPGERVTSTRRSAARNKAVGGVANSYHLSGRARDSVPPPGMSMAEYHRRLQAMNPHLEVINEGDHVHMEPRG